jgi:oligopeptide/dipeptide ABC transporter ATP-binding protein
MVAQPVGAQSLAPPETLMEVRDLCKAFPVSMGFRKKAHISALDGVSMRVQAGTTMGVVGESGCGKSTLARLILGLMAADAGEVLFASRPIRSAGSKLNRGVDRMTVTRDMQMVFQDPYSSLNPRSAAGDTIAFPMKVHGYRRDEIHERTATLLAQVGLHRNHASYYPHQLSGGQRQRVNIARALALKPRFVVCDEAVSALDKSVQAQVLNLLKDLQAEYGLTFLFISHDLNVVEYMSDTVSVMYLGHLVESCPAEDLYRTPLHPYTQVLMRSIPKLEDEPAATSALLDGDIPSALNPPSGCRFRTRCPVAMPVCAELRPAVREAEPDHFVACHLYQENSRAAASGA